MKKIMISLFCLCSSLLLMASDCKDLTELAKALGKSTEEVKALGKLDVSEIQSIRHEEHVKSSTYVANLKNGDSVSASYFLSGRAKGCYHCSRMLGNGSDISMEQDTYHRLAELYEAIRNDIEINGITRAEDHSEMMN